MSLCTSENSAIQKLSVISTIIVNEKDIRMNTRINKRVKTTTKNKKTKTKTKQTFTVKINYQDGP